MVLYKFKAWTTMNMMYVLSVFHPSPNTTRRLISLTRLVVLPTNPNSEMSTFLKSCFVFPIVNNSPRNTKFVELTESTQILFTLKSTQMLMRTCNRLQILYIGLCHLSSVDTLDIWVIYTFLAMLDSSPEIKPPFIMFILSLYSWLSYPKFTSRQLGVFHWIYTKLHNHTLSTISSKSILDSFAMKTRGASFYNVPLDQHPHRDSESLTISNALIIACLYTE